ncbi:MAG: M23 family metallopeptidase [Lachnospiraceae bacterium]|nr:M23 family metallopeptidase [Lachnospiraceae bacterium]
MKKIKSAILIEIICICTISGILLQQHASWAVSAESSGKDFIKWVDFNVSYEALCAAYQWDVDTVKSEHPINWVELLAYMGAKNGGNFGPGDLKEIASAGQALSEGKVTMEELTRDLSYYDYYLEAYGAVLNGYVGEYEVETEPGSGQFEKEYGLKAYLPVAKGFPYSDYDDFGVSRSYGYRRQHLGHDMMGQIGTPIIAVESGYVEAIGWNQYGGWRLGIRSFDKQRYYYYAHLRQNYPYAQGLKEGSYVTAGDVIGYMGHTGYSTTENVNNIDQVHLHFGIQIIFDESQKEGNGEIWVNPYQLIRFLRNHQSETEKIQDTREWQRSRAMKDPAVPREESK